MKNKCIVVGVTAGIAAYKICQLVSSLKKQGNEVHVIMTKEAEKFVTPLTFQTLSNQKVITDMFTVDYTPDVHHISLAKKADLFVVAPATANIIAKIAHGLADDMLTTTFLASTCPKLIVPAMNTFMYRNPIIQENMNKLIKFGFKFVEPDSGLLACGDVGEGKFPSIDKIESFVFHEVEQDLKGKKVLVTAGPTKEFIDPFRCLTNPSTGKMGISLANECARRGAEVILVSSVDNDTISSKIKKIKITSTNDMFEAVKNNFKDCDFIIKAAAVSDYTPVQVFDKKVKKQEGNLTIEFQRTQDILKYVGDNKTDKQKVIGFAAETNNLIEYAKEKIIKKNLDYIVANDISKKDIGFGSDDNEVYIIDKHDNIKKIDKSNKNNIAKAIVDEISK